MLTPELDYGAARFWMDVFQNGGLIALGVYTWWVNREKVTAERFARLEKRLTKVELSGGCAGHGDFDKRLRLVEEAVSAINGRLKGIGHSLNIIQEYLMTRGER